MCMYVWHTPVWVRVCVCFNINQSWPSPSPHVPPAAGYIKNNKVNDSVSPSSHWHTARCCPTFNTENCQTVLCVSVSKTFHLFYWFFRLEVNIIFTCWFEKVLWASQRPANKAFKMARFVNNFYDGKNMIDLKTTNDQLHILIEEGRLGSGRKVKDANIIKLARYSE